MVKFCNIKKRSTWTIHGCFLVLMSGTYAQTPGEWTWMCGVSAGNYIGDFGTMGMPDLNERKDHALQPKSILRFSFL